VSKFISDTSLFKGVVFSVMPLYEVLSSPDGLGFSNSSTHTSSPSAGPFFNLAGAFLRFSLTENLALDLTTGELNEVFLDLSLKEVWLEFYMMMDSDRLNLLSSEKSLSVRPPESAIDRASPFPLVLFFDLFQNFNLFIFYFISNIFDF